MRGKSQPLTLESSQRNGPAHFATSSRTPETDKIWSTKNTAAVPITANRPPRLSRSRNNTAVGAYASTGYVVGGRGDGPPAVLVPLRKREHRHLHRDHGRREGRDGDVRLGVATRPATDQRGAAAPARMHDRRDRRRRHPRRDVGQRRHLRPGRKRHDQGPRRKRQADRWRRQRHADRSGRCRHPEGRCRQGSAPGWGPATTSSSRRTVCETRRAEGLESTARGWTGVSTSAFRSRSSSKRRHGSTATFTVPTSRKHRALPGVRRAGL